MNKGPGSQNFLLVCALLIVSTFAVYRQAGTHEFINYDDNLYITENPHVQQGLTGASIGWAFTTTETGNWHPLTWLSLMTDVRLFGLDPGSHHLVSVGFHILNSLLLFVLFRKMTASVWPGACVAALFALHPLHVESVAWAAERKDVLSTLFWIGAMLAYMKYAERPGLGPYGLALLLFALGLLSKPMVVTLPFILLMIDYWPLGRIRAQNEAGGAAEQARKQSQSRFGKKPLGSLLIEKAPFLALALISGLVTMAAQGSGGAVTPFGALPLGSRIANAANSYLEYVLKMFWPANLAILYPYSAGEIPPWRIVAAGVFLAGVSALAFLAFRKRRYVMVGWLWYVVTLLPVIGLIQVGTQSMADRYTYLPLIGLFVIIAWGVRDLTAGVQSRRVILATAASLALAALSYLSWAQLATWQNSVTVFTRAIEVTSNNWLAHANLGVALGKEGKLNEALAQFSDAVAIRPDYADAYNNMGIVLAMQGKTSDAHARFSEAIRYNPDHVNARYNLGLILTQEGRLDDAAAQYAEVLRLKPDNVEARRALEDANRTLRGRPGGGNR